MKTTRKLKRIFPDQLFQDKDSLNQGIASISLVIDEMKQAHRSPKLKPNKLVQDIKENEIPKGEDESGIIGIVGELFFVDDAKEAQVITKLIGFNKFHGVVYKDNESFNRSYDKCRKSNQSEGTALLNLEMLSSYPKDKEFDFDSRYPNMEKQKGFLGFAIKKIQLKKKHEYLRKTLFFTLLKSAMMFDTMANATSYRKFAMAKSNGTASIPNILCVQDLEILESMGCVTLSGQQKKSLTFCSGQLPLTENSKYTTHSDMIDLFKQAQEIINKQDRNQSSQDKHNIREEIRESEERIEELQNELNVIKNTLSKSDHSLDDLDAIPSKSSKKRKKSISNQLD